MWLCVNSRWIIREYIFNMGVCRIILICLVIGMLIKRGRSRDNQYHIYHHCYQERFTCGTKNISCNDNLVINIVRSFIGYSKYLSLDVYRRNCSITNQTCYKDVDEPSTNCSGLQTCTLYTCSNVTNQKLDCTGVYATNFLRINYTCVEESRSTSTEMILQTTSAKTTVIISAVIVAIVVIAAVVIIIIVIIKRRKHISETSYEDAKQITDSVTSVKDTYITVAGDVNHVTRHDVSQIMNTSGLTCPSKGISTTENSVVDDDNCASINVGGDYEPVDLPPSKTRLSDTELVDNVNYVGFGEEVTGSKVTPTTGDYELAGPCYN